MVRLELRQRVRSTRWVVALVVWLVVVGGLTLLTSGALSTGMVDGEDSGQASGRVLFAAVTLLVLGLGLLVTPTLAATSINGDRTAGTLAILQVTLLSPAEIAVGKLLAAWAAALAFLAVSVPFLVIGLVRGDLPVAVLLRVVGLIALVLLAVCAVGVGWSALVARPAGSTVLTFATVAAVTALAPVLFLVTLPSVTQTEDVQVLQYMPRSEGPGRCTWQTVQLDRPHTERTWWLLAVNPFALVADGAGLPAAPDPATGVTAEPLGALRDAVRAARSGPAPAEDWCSGAGFLVSDGAGPAGSTELTPEDRALLERDTDRSAVWPWGMLTHLVLGAAGLGVAVQRLRIPQRRLARGTRVA